MTDVLDIDGRAWTAAELAALTTPLHVKGNLDLSEWPHPLPTLASIGGNAYLGGFQGDLPTLATIGGWAILEGFQGALPALASIGWWADLEGFQGALPPWLIDGGKDSRGYYFTGMLVAGEWRIRAGCRDFSLEEAREHWGARSASNRPDCLALVEKIAAEITKRENLFL